MRYFGELKKNKNYYIFETCVENTLKKVYVGTCKDFPRLECKYNYVLDVPDITKLQRNEYPNAEYKLVGKDSECLYCAIEKYGIFIFNFDSLLIFSDSEKKYTLIPGFIDVIDNLQRLNPSALFVFFSNSLEDEINEKLRSVNFNHPCEIIPEINKDELKYLTDFLLSRNFLDNSILAFGRTERDALIYSEMKFDFVLVCNKGIPEKEISYFDIVPVEKTVRSFRYNSLYSCRDVDTIYRNSHSDKCELKGFQDEIVVYFKRYYGSRPNELPERRSANFAGILKNAEYASRKVEYINEKGKEIIAKWYCDIMPDKTTIFARVPSHTNKMGFSAMDYFLEELDLKYGGNRNYYDCLLRIKEVEPSKENSRSVKKHMDSIEVNEKYRESLEGKTVYLFDDITTTGASLYACSEKLYQNEVKHVVCFVLAKTGGAKDKYGNDKFDLDYLKNHSYRWQQRNAFNY